MAATKDFLIGVVVGSAIGAACALLYAPMPGVETRQQLKDKATEAKDRTAELAMQAREKASGLVQQAQTKVGGVTEQVKTKASDLGQQAHGLIDRGKEMVDRQREAVTTAIDAGKQAYIDKQSELQADVAQDSLPATTAAPMGI